MLEHSGAAAIVFTENTQAIAHPVYTTFDGPAVLTPFDIGRGRVLCAIIQGRDTAGYIIMYHTVSCRRTRCSAGCLVSHDSTLDYTHIHSTSVGPVVAIVTHHMMCCRRTQFSVPTQKGALVVP